MNDADNATSLVQDLAQRVFASARDIEGGLDQPLVDSFRSTGLDRSLSFDAPTDTRSAGAVLRVAGRAAGSMPVTESMLAQWLAVHGGWEENSGLPTVVTSAEGWQRVPWGRLATRIYFVQEGRIARAEGCTILRQGSNVAGEPRDVLAAGSGRTEVSSAAADPDELFCLAALCRAAMMAGAMERALEVCVGHARERVQFGRPIAQFQAVQQMLAQLAGLAAVSSAAVDLALSDPFALAVGVAKARVGEAAGLATEIAHQVCGAMGYTMEFPLQRLTRRLWAWRDEDGSEFWWQQRVGMAIAGAGSESLWSLLADPPRSTRRRGP